MKRLISEPKECEFDKQIFLESLDGFDFEKLCATIFQCQGYSVENVRDVSDEGRDLILRTKEGASIVVECKHHPNKIIGRPAVQKLHSAVITSNADHGILVTSGKFSKAAVDYASKVGVRLMDLHQLAIEAEQAGIKLWHKGQLLQTYVTKITRATIQTKLHQELLKRVHSHPKPSEELIRLNLEAITIYPIYYLKYDIHEYFATRAGLIHQIHETDQTFYLTTLGEPVPSHLIHFWENCKMVPLAELPSLVGSKAPQLEGWPLKKNPFHLDISSLTKEAKQMICKAYTKTVGYYGRNNVYYERECQPSIGSVFIHNIGAAYLLSWRLKVQISSGVYSFEVAMGSKDFEILVTNLMCEVCQKHIKGDLLICNMCWQVTHDKDCGFFCDTCNKTVCLFCSCWKYKTPQSKVHLCPECALQEAQQGKAVFIC